MLASILIGLIIPIASAPLEVLAGNKAETSGALLLTGSAVQSPTYRIYPLQNGVCKIAGNHAFYEGNNTETFDYALYIWLILGGDKPILVDAGLSNVNEMNRGAAHVLREPISQNKQESSIAQLRKFGLTPDDIGYVLITHLHFDHVDDLLNYKNAKVYIGKKEWELASSAAPSWGHGKIMQEFINNPACKQRLVLVEDQEILPGIESFWIGGHTPGSMAYRVNTPYGKAVLTGDTVSLLANFERNIPPGVFTNYDECIAAIKKIREKADTVLPGHDPGVLDRWPASASLDASRGSRPLVSKDAIKHTIQAIKVGQCEVRDYITFQDTSSEETSTFYLYIWVIRGGHKTIVVETGPKYPEEFSKATARYIPGGVRQLPQERTIEALKSHGIEPAEVSYVIATHLHADHYDYFDAFPNARFVVNRQEYSENKNHLASDVRKALDSRPDALQLVDDEEIVPGVRVFPLGCHTPGSQGVLVRTYMGPAVITGDVVYKYENIEKDRPTRSPDPNACRQAMAHIRTLADIILPAHDPLTLERWPDGIIGVGLRQYLGAGEPAIRLAGKPVPITTLTVITESNPGQPIRYAIEQLSTFCKQSAQIEVQVCTQWTPGPGPVVLVGRDPAEKYASSVCKNIRWDDLGSEGFILRLLVDGDSTMVITAGATDSGTRHAIYTLLRELDVSKLPATLPPDLNIIEKPSFALRGMYAHQHWAYSYPYALRTWTVEEWKKYVDILALMRVNLFQIWSMAGILPVPFSPEDEAFLRRYPPVIDHAKQNHYMEVWIGECANNMCDKRDLPPAEQRDYFKVETLKNPADPNQMAQLKAARGEFYKICNNADGYWVIDSDPGGWRGSPASEFVDILMMNREIINNYTKLGPKAKLVYWMWFGWGNKQQSENWQDTISDLLARSPEPWWLTVAFAEHWKVADRLKVTDRVIYYPYGAVEPEPSLPFTTVVPPVLQKALNVPERIGKIRGAMGNAQTPLCQLPNIYYFTQALWNMELRSQPPAEAMRELAKLIYPQKTELLTKAWLCLGDLEASNAETMADELMMLDKNHQLGRPGPIGIKLFPDYGQIARDLAVQLRIHSAAMRFCKMVNEGNPDDKQLLDQLTEYCLLSLEWRKHTGFRNYGTNGCNFFPVRDAVHKKWWHNNRLDPEVQNKLAESLKAKFEDWEVALIIGPLSQ